MTEQEEKSVERRESQASYISREDATATILVKGEKVLVQGIIHPAIYWKGVAVLIFGILLSLKIVQLGILLGVVGLLMLAMAVITKHFLLIALTDRRVLSRYGVVQVDVVAIQFKQIESLELERMLIGQIFGYATVVVMGTGRRTIRVPFIANASEFRQKYDDVTLAENEEDKKAAKE